jgi:hypothetical protein
MVLVEQVAEALVEVHVVVAVEEVVVVAEVNYEF